MEQIRGVKCDYSLQSLIYKGLIQEIGRKDTIGRPILFGTTDEFLRRFGLESKDELPEMDPVQYEEIVASVESEIAAAEAKENLAQAESVKVEI